MNEEYHLPLFRPHHDNLGRITGYVHSFDTGSAVDGPGLRFTLFVSGCQFHCLYCHNPDTRYLHSGELMSVDEVMKELAKYVRFLQFSGGLTISGGEPLVQAYFTGEIFRRAKKELDLHTTLDTQGFLAKHLPDEWFDNIDLVLLDIKQINPEKHLALTAQPVKPTLDFARRLSALGKKMWIRYVLVPGYTDDFEDIEQLAEFIDSLNGVERIDILPFHKMGEHKWRELGMDYLLDSVMPPSAELVDQVRRHFSKVF